jgi:type I restriction enzyme S subunit
LVTAKNVKVGYIDYECSKEYIPQDSYNEVMRRGQPLLGDVLITTEAPLGNVASIDRIGVALAQRIIKLRAKESVLSNDFLKYVLLSEPFQKLLREKSSGSTAKGIKGSVLHKLPLRFPSTAEQQKISAFLSAVYEKIEQLARKKELLLKYKEGVIQQIFDQRIRFKDANAHDFRDWKETKIRDLADKKVRWSFTGGPFGSNLKAEDYTETGIRIVQLQNIGDGEFLNDYAIFTTARKADELLSCNIYPGEIIISKMGDPVARACLVPATDQGRYLMASDGIRLSVDTQRFVPKFVHDSINYYSFRKQAFRVSTGSTRRRIGLEDLRNLTLKVPQVEEQIKIASLLSALDEKINLVAQQLEKTKTFKKGLLQQMFV